VIALLALILLQAPQEDDSKRATGAALGLPGFQQKTPPPPTPDPVTPASFMTPRAKRALEDYKELLDHNVFSPPRKKDPPKEKTPEGSKPPEGPRSRTWTLTGIVFNAIDKRYEALIEEPTTKESKYCKEGDSIAGVKITAVNFDQVAYVKDEKPGVLKLKDTISEPLAPGANGGTSVKPEEQGDIEKARDRMKKRHRRESVPDEAEEDADAKKKPK
jgi:type II secretory pathway component PulC